MRVCAKDLFPHARLPPTLRQLDFRLFTIGCLPAETGEYSQFVVQNWLAWELTRLAFSLVLPGICEFAPRIVFGPIGGVVADRMDRIQLLKLNRLANLSLPSEFAVSGSAEFHGLAAVLAYGCPGGVHGDRQLVQHGGSKGGHRRLNADSATARGWRDQLGRTARS